MDFSPDSIVYVQWGVLKINATIAFSWAITLVMTLGAMRISRNLASGASVLSAAPGAVSTSVSRQQNMLEAIVSLIQTQIKQVSQQETDRYLPFIGTLFLFIAAANLLDVVPGFKSPTASLSTAVALATLVFVAVPVFGIASQGLRGYLRHYVQPSPLMLPFNIIGELSRTVSLAIRLFGNIMSGSLVVAVLLSLAPLFLPIAMQLFGMLIGLIQAYVFSILALIYIASAERVHYGEGPIAPEAAPEAAPESVPEINADATRITS